METEDPWDGDDGDELEAEIMRADHSFGVDLRGTTAEEALEGEGLEQALAEERPEGPTTDQAFEVVDDGDPDVEGQLVAEGALLNDEYASPEEAALSIRDEAPGATDHEDPHPADGA
jgi:hypothetical protein